jgi:hypothetical protein
MITRGNTWRTSCNTNISSASTAEYCTGVHRGTPKICASVVVVYQDFTSVTGSDHPKHHPHPAYFLLHSKRQSAYSLLHSDHEPASIPPLAPVSHPESSVLPHIRHHSFGQQRRLNREGQKGPSSSSPKGVKSSWFLVRSSFR